MEAAPRRRAVGTPFQGHLGVGFVSGDSGDVVVEMAIRDDLRGPAGSLEGGVIATLVDVAGASAAARALSGMVATSAISVSYLAPGRIGPVRAAGTVMRAGRTDAVVEVRVIDAGNEDRLMAVALVTVRRLGDRPADPGSPAAPPGPPDLASS